MKELTIQDMALNLGATSVAINSRLKRKGRKPFKYIGSAGIYTEDDQEAIREAPRGRPPVASKVKPAVKAKKKKATKKT